MLAALGLPIAPRPLAPVLHGVLYTDRDPAYLRRPLAGASGATPEPRGDSLWWPPSKIAGRLLSAYLAVRAGAPRAPESRPSSDVAAVRVDLRETLERGSGPAPTPMSLI
jgi:hypothetical protein